MRIRWKLLGLLLTTALAPLIVASVLSSCMTRRTGKHLAGQLREDLTDSARRQLHRLVDDYGRIIKRDEAILELALRSQAREVEHRLASNPPADAVVFMSEDYDSAVKLPAGMAPSDTHFRLGPGGEATPVRVTYQQQVSFVVAGLEAGPSAAAQADLARLSTMPQVYRALYASGLEMTYWQYTSLESGIHTCYPGHGGYPAEFDPRGRPWYVNARRSTGPTWGPLLADVSTRMVLMTLAMPVHRPDGTFAGVTAVDVPISGLLDELQLPLEWASSAETFLVVPAPADTEHEGELVILVHRGYQGRREDWTVAVRREHLTSPDSEELAALAADALAGRSGVRELRHRGEEAMWAYGAGKDHARGFPVVIVPRARIVARAVQTEAYVGEEIVRGLQVGGLILLIVTAVVAAVSFFSSRAVTRPIRELAAAAGRLAEGDYQARALVHTGDELQNLAEVFNDVGPKLGEREKMKQSLALAMEIQQHLLPQGAPELPGFDIAGRCEYCDETGGDYYDFIDLAELGSGRLGIAVGDVTGHGIGAALLMASARAILRSQAGQCDDMTKLFATLNEHLVRDTSAERFMTMFYGVLEADSRKLSWTSGGHDPALWLRRVGGRFEELSGTGMPLGIAEDAPFGQAGPVTLESGDIVLVGTDGIWEAANADAELFGKDRLREVMVAAADRTAADIHTAVVDAVTAFRGSAPQTDDITLVIIKAL